VETRLLISIEGWPSGVGVGDPGAHRFVAEAWRAAAHPTLSTPLPTLGLTRASGKFPSDSNWPSSNHPGAVWVAALQLCMFSLGWQSPALGLHRWRREGHPTEDPRLEVIAHLLGPDVVAANLNLLAFLFSRAASQLSVGGPASFTQREWEAVPVPHDVNSYVETDHGHLVHMPFDGGGSKDPCHIAGHAVIADRHISPVLDSVLVADRSTGTAALIVDGYAGWYEALAERAAKLASRADGRSWRIEVVVKPVGWLGTFRQSRRTGRWFSGPHSLHMWGSLDG
jgi:hypothetical protein